METRSKSRKHDEETREFLAEQQAIQAASKAGKTAWTIPAGKRPPPVRHDPAPAAQAGSDPGVQNIGAEAGALAAADQQVGLIQMDTTRVLGQRGPIDEPCVGARGELRPATGHSAPDRHVQSMQPASVAGVRFERMSRASTASNASARRQLEAEVEAHKRRMTIELEKMEAERQERDKWAELHKRLIDLELEAEKARILEEGDGSLPEGEEEPAVAVERVNQWLDNIAPRSDEREAVVPPPVGEQPHDEGELPPTGGRPAVRARPPGSLRLTASVGQADAQPAYAPLTASVGQADAQPAYAPLTASVGQADAQPAYAPLTASVGQADAQPAYAPLTASVGQADAQPACAPIPRRLHIERSKPSYETAEEPATRQDERALALGPVQPQLALTRDGLVLAPRRQEWAAMPFPHRYQSAYQTTSTPINPGRRAPIVKEPATSEPAFATPARTAHPIHPTPQATAQPPPPSDGTAAAFDRLASVLKEAVRPQPPRQVFELPIYYGDPGEWTLFYNAYIETTMRYNFSSYENMARLRNSLRGEARQCVQHLLSTATQPDLVIRLLKKNFGRTDLLIDKALEDLRRLPPLGPSAVDLNTFATKVINIVSTLVDLDRRNYADNPLLIREVTERLSPHLRSRWCSYAREHTRTSNEGELMMMAAFLMEESDAELQFSHAKAPPRRKDNNRNDQRGSNIPARTSTWTPIHKTYTTNASEKKCLACGGNHTTPACRKVKEMLPSARWDWARKNMICYKCLDSKHRKETCRAAGCGIQGCPHAHHRLLHETQRTVAPRPKHSAPRMTIETQTETVRQPANETNFTSNVRHNTEGSVMLKVIPISIEGPLKRIDTFALLDEGSTISLADENLIDEIGATGPEVPLSIQGVGSMQTNSNKSRRVRLALKGRSNGPTHEIEVRTIRDLGLKGQQMPARLTQYPHLADLSDAMYSSANPRVLIGADNWHLMLPLETRRGKRTEPAAVRTELGWVIYGCGPRVTKERYSETSLHCHLTDSTLNEELKHFFSIDSLGVKPIEKGSPTDQRASDIFNKTVRKISGPHYEVGQLWKTDSPELPPSYENALKRLKSIERKMDRDDDFATQYETQINNLIEKGYAHEVKVPPTSPLTFYLPHFAVTNANKPDKIRTVFDAACPNNGKCLNDFLLEGPDLLQNLMGILFRFREGQFAVVADIAEMFLRIKIRKEDQPSQLFLWRGRERKNPPKTYQMSSMLFGASSSPFLAHCVRNHNANDNAERYPAAVIEITTNHYMDDFVSSFNTESSLISSALQVQAAHREGGFELRGWSSNSDELLKIIPKELQATTPAQLGNKNPYNKILGLLWDPDTDTLGFNTNMVRVPSDVKELLRPPTKREMLSAVMSIYDPLGLISHYTILAKIQLQVIWRKAIDWDAPLPEPEQRNFETWLKGLKGVAELRLPRCYLTPGPGELSVKAEPARELHVFVDASTQAYACVAYWRTRWDKLVNITLIAAKAKVAPTKQLSIPRLELQAALIGARMAAHIQKYHRYRIDNITLWTDSRTVLYWVRNNAKRYSTYVAHRLGEIAELTKEEQWRWVPTKVNPADQASRYDINRKVKYDDEWYQGPQFLRQPAKDWPLERPTNEPLLDTEEQKFSAHIILKLNQAPFIDINRFSNYERLINATARVFQFIDTIKTKQRSQLQVKHRIQAEHLWQQWAQRTDFAEELHCLETGEPLSKASRLYRLDPVLSDEGLLVMRGRIDAAPVHIEKRPVILDGRNKYTRLLILDAHKKALHANNETVVNNLRQKFWILHLRPTVRYVAANCQLCMVKKVMPQVPAKGNLPRERIEPYIRAFSNTGMDLFGPVYVTIGRRREKRWVALFTCMTVRAIHLEIVSNLSTDAAIMALRRMAARRGWPRSMWSDNGTNFRGADQELRVAFAEWLPALQEFGVCHNMEWRFIPPGAPNQGGAWERLVRSVKTALGAILQERAPKEEVLATLLAEAENTINSRSLTHVSVDHRDEEALTPNHFLLGGSSGLPPSGPCDEADRRAWRASQALADHFWARWVREYLPTLAPRQQPQTNVRRLQEGDIVIIVDATLPRNTWPRGIVRTVYPGPDGHVRSADVETRGGVFRRPVTKIAVLPCGELTQARQRGECGERDLHTVGDATTATNGQ